MATWEEAARIAMAMPGALENSDGYGFSVLNGKRERGFAWAWRERVAPKKPRVLTREVLVVSTASLMEKEAWLTELPGVCFTEPHYNGYSAVHVRLAAIENDVLAELITEAWCAVAPKAAVAEWDAARGSSAGASPDVE